MNISKPFHCKNLTFRYGEHMPAVLENCTLSFKPDSITLVTGASGSGKSTLCSVMAGIYPNYGGELESGEVLLGEDNIHHISSQRRAQLVGVLFQNPALQFCTETVESELIFCMENIALPADEIESRLVLVLKQIGMSAFRHRKLHSLSGGEKQKISLACVLSLRPDWILLDEPFANLDDKSAADIRNLLVSLKEIYNFSVVVVDHELELWLPVADEIIVLEQKGKLKKYSISKAACLPKQPMIKPIFADSSNQEPAALAPSLSISNLAVSYGESPVLNCVNAVFYPKNVYVITGRSGSGKSTLLKAVQGIIPYSGEIRCAKNKPKGVSRFFKNTPPSVGFVFQNPQDQFVAYTVLDEILASLKYSGNSIEENLLTAETGLNKIGLWRYRNLSPYMLSQGQQRRLAVLTMLYGNYDVLVCDEPTYAQDSVSKKATLDLLVQNVFSKGQTLVLITHDLALVEAYADTAFLLEGGKLYPWGERLYANKS